MDGVINLYDVICTSFKKSRETIQDILYRLSNAHPVIPLLVAEGILYFEEKTNAGQIMFIGSTFGDVLKTWRCKYPQNDTDILNCSLLYKKYNSKIGAINSDQHDVDQDDDHFDLFKAFGTTEGFNLFLEALDVSFQQISDPTIILLAIQGFYGILNEINQVGDQDSFKFNLPKKMFHTYLRRWNQDSPQDFLSYEGGVPERLSRSLTILFKSIGVPFVLPLPMFTDTYGDRYNLSQDFNPDDLDPIEIYTDLPLYHVTHIGPAQSIIKQSHIKSSCNSTNKPGTWFGMLPLGEIMEESVYGSRAFITYFSKLGITGLCQGELISYKDENNVILYATNDPDASFSGLKKPKIESIWRVTERDKSRPDPYLKFSIFVPEQFLPAVRDFKDKICGPFKVKHDCQLFCLGEKRGRWDVCPDLGKDLVRGQPVIPPLVMLL